ncbi:MAG: 23S rRNA (adenine(2503)-C(2))-methyltransferase RlmN [Bacteroidales bacterium]|nr:23S rRNA (adenine(2503)-C(2))-methyltransferase RlmN [Bacteroidales bacterium]
MPKEKADILSLSLKELEDFFKSNNDKSFRAKQVYEWLWKKAVRSFEEMTNLSKETRQLLNDNFTLTSIEICSVQKSTDGTVKIAFRLYDKLIIEGVLIPDRDRITACISSQAGCNLDCKFCATAKLGLQRNLNTAEIFDQVVLLRDYSIKHFKHNLSNIVLMGMGEPLLNYENVTCAINLITSEDGLNISYQRITISTVGLPKMLRKLGDDKVKVNLAVSLHSAVDEKRNEIIPVNIHNPLKELSSALKYYYSKTENRITIEYILLKDFNDSLVDAKELATFCKSFPCKINIIEFNNVENTEYYPSTHERKTEFVNFLESKNMIVNVRRSRGKDIDAACGQLAGKIINNE